ncbi:UNVERIFIED_ORG: DNA-binding SARP family transcriptional activator [Arthrobacter sp. UYCu721]
MGNDGYGHFQLSLLQSWQLRCDAGIVHVAARQQRLITALAITGPRPRSYLVGLLWPEHSEARALESLRVSVHLVSRQVPGLLINGGTVLSLSELVEVDLHRVRAQIQEVSLAGLNGNVASCLHLLRDAELLPGWYEDWVLFEQSRLRQERLHAFTLIARESLARRDYESALEAAEAALELEPLYESAVGLLIQAESKQGNLASALRAFEKYQAKLKEDMGLAPSEAIRRLAADIRGTHAARERGTPRPGQGSEVG